MSRYFDDSLHHIDDNSDYLAHYGRKGMKWGKNIFEEDARETAAKDKRHDAMHRGLSKSGTAKTQYDKYENAIYEDANKMNARYNAMQKGLSKSGTALSARKADWAAKHELYDKLNARKDAMNSEIKKSGTASSAKKADRISQLMEGLLQAENKQEYLDNMYYEDYKMLMSIFKNAKGE